MPTYTARVIRTVIDEHAATLTVEADTIDDALELFEEMELEDFQAAKDYHAADEVKTHYRNCLIDGAPATRDNDWADAC